VGEAELLTMAELEEEDDDDAGDSLGAMGDGEDEGEELEELDKEDADDVEAVEEDEEGEASSAHDGAAEPEADERRPRRRGNEANAAAEGPVSDDDGDGSEGGVDDVTAAALEVDSSDTEDESEEDAEMDAAYEAAERAMAASSRGDDESEGEGGDPVHALRDLLNLSLPAALERAHTAIRYLRHAFERRPDSCLYAACLAQTLAFVHALTETHSGAAESADVDGRDGEDAEAITPMAEARQVLYALAHPNQRPCAIPAPTEAGGDAPVASAPAVDAPASMPPTSAPHVAAPAASSPLLPLLEPIPSVAARELWLHWLQQHEPDELEARARATVALLQLDGRSDRGAAELARLLPLVYGDAADAIDDAAARALPLETALHLVSHRLELYPNDESAWGALEFVLIKTACNPSDDSDEGLRAALVATRDEAARWWATNYEWWPRACFAVHELAARLLPAARPASRRGTLWEAKQRCAEQLLLVLEQAVRDEGGDSWKMLLGHTRRDLKALLLL
jgi:hypothetical protein